MIGIYVDRVIETNFEGSGFEPRLSRISNNSIRCIELFFYSWVCFMGPEFWHNNGSLQNSVGFMGLYKIVWDLYRYMIHVIDGFLPCLCWFFAYFNITGLNPFLSLSTIALYSASHRKMYRPFLYS